jgi:hypothetical protein
MRVQYREQLRYYCRTGALEDWRGWRKAFNDGHYFLVVLETRGYRWAAAMLLGCHATAIALHLATARHLHRGEIPGRNEARNCGCANPHKNERDHKRRHPSHTNRIRFRRLSANRHVNFETSLSILRGFVLILGISGEVR